MNECSQQGVRKQGTSGGGARQLGQSGEEDGVVTGDSRAPSAAVNIYSKYAGRLGMGGSMAVVKMGRNGRDEMKKGRAGREKGEADEITDHSVIIRWQCCVLYGIVKSVYNT